MKNYKFLTPFLFSFLLISCSHNRLDIDTKDVQVPDFTINRLEQDVFKMDTSDVKASTDKLISKYGKFYSAFISGIINNGGLRDSSYSFRIKRFIGDRDMHDTYVETQKAYPSTDQLKTEMTDVFKRFRFHFPDRNIPAVVTMVSGFQNQAVVFDSTLAIGLEMYLGSEHKFYQMLAWPRYKTMFMNKENMVPDATRIWMMNEFPYNMNKSDFLSEITYIGKIMYLSDALLPLNLNDTVKIQYTSAQLDYCRQNEFNVWSYFAAQKLLYTTDQAEITKYTADGPFTSALSKDSAPRIGYWIGWQIIRQYMNNNPDITLEKLMQETDAQKILTKAKYKPGK
jgi:hypothetical protein